MVSQGSVRTMCITPDEYTKEVNFRYLYNYTTVNAFLLIWNLATLLAEQNSLIAFPINQESIRQFCLFLMIVEI